MFKGCFVAIVTPFKKGEIDEEAIRRVIQFCLEKGVDGIVPCGTTGESPTLSSEEHKRVIEITIDEVKGRVPVIAGTGSNNTKEAEELTEFAKKAGADGALIITPYYNKPTQNCLEAHYRKLDAIGVPIVIYNVPSRTGVNISPATVAKLSRLNNIIGIKEASGSMDQISSIIAASDPNFFILSGNDSQTLPILSLGGMGVISVVANIIPEETAKMISLYLKGDIDKARKLHYKIYPLCEAMFIETNPLPIKTAMAKMGMIQKEWRLPLGEMREENEVKVEKALHEYGLL
ncbi:MAG: 4-hydroxy-tetrahydrodipicolinate synthase [Candidatus Aerophobetes bacterium]|nr:4-hydroxy-tetrahydrodipicolinate synthase [Candidatus Aerophobetes bacterium]